MRVLALLVVFVPVVLSACSPAPPSVQQKQTGKEGATPTKDKSIHVSEKGW